MVMVVDMKVVFTFNMSDHIKYMWIGVICCDEWVMLVDIKVFHSFNMSDNIKFMCVDGQRYCGWQG